MSKFPFEKARRPSGGAQLHAATVESDLDLGNPHRNSLRGLLRERDRLLAEYGRADAVVWEIDGKIVDRLAELAGKP